jgi:co-chaperonin GroES (HSP10)
MSKELDELVLLGDGVLVKKPTIEDKQGSLHLPSGYAEKMLPMYECEVVKVGPGDQKEMHIQVGDIACLPKGPQYAEVLFDGKVHFIIAQHNILFLKRKNKINT